MIKTRMVTTKIKSSVPLYYKAASPEILRLVSAITRTLLTSQELSPMVPYWKVWPNSPKKWRTTLPIDPRPMSRLCNPSWRRCSARQFLAFTTWIKKTTRIVSHATKHYLRTRSSRMRMAQSCETTGSKDWQRLANASICPAKRRLRLASTTSVLVRGGLYLRPMLMGIKSDPFHHTSGPTTLGPLAPLRMDLDQASGPCLNTLLGAPILPVPPLDRRDCTRSSSVLELFSINVPHISFPYMQDFPMISSGDSYLYL